jgi:hypothetical protein
MKAQRPYLVFDSTRNPRKALKSLYARRFAIDAVIQSLEEYNRYRTRRLDPARRKTA